MVSKCFGNTQIAAFLRSDRKRRLKQVVDQTSKRSYSQNGPSSSRSSFNNNNPPRGLIHRSMQNYQRNGRKVKQCHKLTVFCYNILSDVLMKANSRLYTKLKRENLNWVNRWNGIADEITQFDSKVICLQEVELSEVEKGNIGSFMQQQGYEFRYKQRTPATFNKTDGVLTCVKKDQCQIVDHQGVEYYRETSTEDYNSNKVNKPNVALLCLVKMKSTNKFVCVCNTHLLFSPNRGDIKLVQICTLLAEINKFVSRHSDKNPSVIMCGDFNSTPDSLLYKFITQTKLNLKNKLRKDISGQQSHNKSILDFPPLPQILNISPQCTFVKRKNLSESWSDFDGLLSHSVGNMQASCPPDKNHATTTQDDMIQCDHMFHTSSKNGDGLQLLRNLRIPYSHEMRRAGQIPNDFHPSDHLPLFAEYKVN